MCLSAFACASASAHPPLPPPLVSLSYLVLGTSILDKTSKKREGQSLSSMRLSAFVYASASAPPSSLLLLSYNVLVTLILEETSLSTQHHQNLTMEGRISEEEGERETERERALPLCCCLLSASASTPPSALSTDVFPLIWVELIYNKT